jgi:hypothetical protein
MGDRRNRRARHKRHKRRTFARWSLYRCGVAVARLREKPQPLGWVPVTEQTTRYGGFRMRYVSLETRRRLLAKREEP